MRGLLLCQRLKSTLIPSSSHFSALPLLEFLNARCSSLWMCSLTACPECLHLLKLSISPQTSSPFMGQIYIIGTEGKWFHTFSAPVTENQVGEITLMPVMFSNVWASPALASSMCLMPGKIDFMVSCRACEILLITALIRHFFLRRCSRSSFAT